MKCNAIQTLSSIIWLNIRRNIWYYKYFSLYLLCEIKRNMMKYLEQYLKEKMKIKVLGNLSTRESNLGGDVGVSLVIDGYEPEIEV